MRCALVVMAALLGGSPVLAQHANPHEGAAALRRQDRRLDAEYRRLRERLRHDPQQQAALRNDQRDWLRHRDFACSGAVGGKQLPCLIRETAARADQIEKRLR